MKVYRTDEPGQAQWPEGGDYADLTMSPSNRLDVCFRFADGEELATFCAGNSTAQRRELSDWFRRIAQEIDELQTEDWSPLRQRLEGFVGMWPPSACLEDIRGALAHEEDRDLHAATTAMVDVWDTVRKSHKCGRDERLVLRDCSILVRQALEAARD